MGALKKLSKKVSSDKAHVKHVATIAANGDTEIGSMIAEAMDKVGNDGVITIEEGKTLDTKVNVIQGMQFDRGYLSPHFVTDPERMQAVLDNPLVLIWEDKISAAAKLVPLLETVSKRGRPLLIIAEDIEGDALATLVLNKLRGVVQTTAVKAPGYGDRRKAMLEDIAILTGAHAFFKDLGVDLENVTIDELGTCRRATIEAENTTLVDGGGSQSDLSSRMRQIRQEIEKSDSDYDKEKLQERLAKLAGGVAQIEVGAATETEMKEKKSRVEDALHATRAAVEEGILPGGGTAFLRAEKAVGESMSSEAVDGDARLGAKVAPRRALRPRAHDRGERGLRGRRRRPQAPRHGPERGLRRRAGKHDRHVRGRHRGPDEGLALGAPERRERRDAPDLHGLPRRDLPEDDEGPEMPGGMDEDYWTGAGPARGRARRAGSKTEDPGRD